jgi:hypothetical protein
MSEDLSHAKNLENENKEIVDSLVISNSGSLLEDITNLENINDFEITTTQVPDIELKEIIIKETGNFLNLKENVVNIPIEMIVFPFFTYQKQNKRINFEYDFRDLGVKMFSILNAKSSADKVFQPSTFEEKIYTYLISMYEHKKEKNDNEDYIEFEIADFITNFLGNKMNRTYYIKVEQALKNLKSTEYQFIISNHTTLGKYKFEDAEFKLLTYQKLSKGKKKYYRVTLNKNVRQKIKSKRYIIYNSKSLLEILTKDPIAGRIYRYISKIRYDKGIGNINVRTLAAIIPLKTEQYTKKKDKNGNYYVLDRLKQVLKRIEKAFDCLVDLGYILKGYEVKESKVEKTYYIEYKFNPEKDGKCHISEYIINNKKREKEDKKEYQKEYIEDAQIVTERNLTVLDNKPLKLKMAPMDEKESEIIFPENLLESIRTAKKNIYVNNAWKKGFENKILHMLDKYGTNTVKDILNKLYRSVNKPITTTLVKYVDGMLKNMGKDKNNLTLFDLSGILTENNKESVVNREEKEEQEKQKEEKQKEDNILTGNKREYTNKEILERFNKIEENRKTLIIEESIRLYLQNNKINEDFFLNKNILESDIYFSMLKNYIKDLISDEK